MGRGSSRIQRYFSAGRKKREGRRDNGRVEKISHTSERSAQIISTHSQIKKIFFTIFIFTSALVNLSWSAGDNDVVSHVEPDVRAIVSQEYRTLLNNEDLILEDTDRADGPALHSASDSLDYWQSYNQWLCFSSYDISVEVVEINYDGKVKRMPVLRVLAPTHQFKLSLSSEIDEYERVANEWRDLMDGSSIICTYVAFLQNLESSSLWIISRLKTNKGIWIESEFSTSGESPSEKHVGPYRIVISRTKGQMAGRIEIRKNEELIFEEEEMGSYFFWGNNFVESNKKSDDLSGMDFTGNGVPDLLISKWTGGSNCCHVLYVFELGEEFKRVTTVETGTHNFAIVDLDGDDIPEIEFWDGAIDSLFSSFAHSAQGRVVLKFANGHYEISCKHMNEPLPTENILSEKRSLIRTAFEQNESPHLPYEFLEFMMNLSYQGHLDAALQMADDIWPQYKTGLSKFKSSFKEAMDSSQYWSKFNVDCKF